MAKRVRQLLEENEELYDQLYEKQALINELMRDLDEANEEIHNLKLQLMNQQPQEPQEANKAVDLIKRVIDKPPIHYIMIPEHDFHEEVKNFDLDKEREEYMREILKQEIQGV